MRYIDWIAFAYRMRNIVRNIKIELEMPFDFDIEISIEKVSSMLAGVDGLINFIGSADCKHTIISLLGIQVYQELVIDLELLKSSIKLLESNVIGQFEMSIETLINNVEKTSSDVKLDFNITTKAIDRITKLINVSTFKSHFIINAEVYSGILHEITHQLEFELESLIDAIIVNVLEMSTEIVAQIDADIDFEISLGMILEAFKLNAVFSSTAELNEVKTKISKANTKFNLDIIATVKKEIMRLLSDTYPTLLSNVLDMSILEFYYIYE